MIQDRSSGVGERRSNDRKMCFFAEVDYSIQNNVYTAPIKNMRFDETLYHFFGDRLAAFTDFSEIIPETSTYFRRELGGVKVPGMLVDDFTFNL